LFPINVYCKLLASQVLLMGYKEMEIAGHQTAKWNCDWLQYNSWEVMAHPHYNPDLISSDFHLSESYQKHVGGKLFATDANTKQAVTSKLQTLDTNFICLGAT